MHEHAIMNDLMRKIEEVARSEGARRVTQLKVRLGALAHMTPAHFLEHFADAARGTVAEGAQVSVEQSADVYATDALDVLLESIDVER
jgi:hydrogenase nickel incorporation protein HypA/HybF